MYSFLQIRSISGWKLTDLSGEKLVSPKSENEGVLMYNTNEHNDNGLFYWKAPKEFNGNLVWEILFDEFAKVIKSGPQCGALRVSEVQPHAEQSYRSHFIQSRLTLVTTAISLKVDQAVIFLPDSTRRLQTSILVNWSR